MSEKERQKMHEVIEHYLHVISDADLKWDVRPNESGKGMVIEGNSPENLSYVKVVEFLKINPELDGKSDILFSILYTVHSEIEETYKSDLEALVKDSISVFLKSEGAE